MDAASQALALQQKMSALGQEERQLELRQLQLRSQLTSYEKQEQEARASQRENLERLVQQRAQGVRSQLESVDKRLAEVRTQKEQVFQQLDASSVQQALKAHEKELAAHRPQERTVFVAQDAPPRPSKRKRRRLIVAGLAVIVVAVAVAVVLPVLRPQAADQVSVPTIKDCVKYLAEICYGPTQVQNAYRLPALYHKGYDGRGQTIVIIGTSNPTTLKSDLHKFDVAWGLADPPSFQIVAAGGGPLPKCAHPVPELLGEDALDVEWAHAMAPGANIVLVLAAGDAPCGLRNFSDLDGAIAYAIDNHLGNIISLSYGISELDAAGIVQEEHALFERAAQEGITVLAASGDAGPTNPAEGTGDVWPQPNIGLPASDPYVLAVGGTILALTDNGDYNGEVAWNLAQEGATGGGLSKFYPEPAYQRQVSNQALFQGKRAIPDVAFTASSALIYGSFEPGELAGVKEEWANWHIIFGTSLSTPCWAGLVAIANQMRGKPLGWLQPVLYTLHGRGFHDITSGDNSVDGLTGYKAAPGYDLTTGWGTPIADQLLPALVDAANQLG